MSYEVSVIAKLAKHREWCEKNLPIENSVIAYDLILQICHDYAKSNRRNVKQFFGSFPHSYTAVRQHYKRLINDGWIVITGGSSDRRVKYIEPTEKFILLMREYFKVIENIFAADMN